MIVELRWGGINPYWLCSGASGFDIASPHTSNALDWLWQKINKVKGELAVGKDGNVIFITDEVCTGIGAEVPTLFTGTAREVVQQLRPYMAMMEGM